MTTPSFAELEEQFGIENKTLAEVTQDRLFDLADFLIDNDIEMPEDPSDQFAEDFALVIEHHGLTTDDVLTHWGKKGMEWGKRKKDKNKNGIDDDLEARDAMYEDIFDGDGDARAPEVATEDRPMSELFNPDAKLNVELVSRGTKRTNWIQDPDDPDSYRNGGKIDDGARVVVKTLVPKKKKQPIAHSASEDEYIAHWGVLGMKWGKRKGRDGKYVINTARQAGNHPGHGEGGEKLDKPSRKAPPARDLSDGELQAVINRFRLEQQYNQIMAPKKNALGEATKEVLKQAAKKQAAAYATRAIAFVGDKAIDAISSELKKQAAKQK